MDPIIKPSNILVTLHDGVPVPKVIDFGIAKATQFELTEKTVYTQLQQFIGTPAYMSPEQAEMSGLDIDTRIGCRPSRIGSIILAITMTLLPTARAADDLIEDCNDGDADEWTDVNPANYELPPSYTFPDGAHRVLVYRATPTFYSGGGYSYVTRYRTNLIYSDFDASLDLLAEESDYRNTAAILARVSGVPFVDNYATPGRYNNYTFGTFPDAAGSRLAITNSGPAIVATALATDGIQNRIEITALPVFASYPVQVALLKYSNLSGRGHNFILGGLPSGSTGALLHNVANGSVDLLLTSGPN